MVSKSAALLEKMKPAPVSLEMLEKVEVLQRNRVSRAKQKRIEASIERFQAWLSYCHAKADKAAFIASQPDDQLRMF